MRLFNEVERLRRSMAKTAMRASDSPFYDLLNPSAKAFQSSAIAMRLRIGFVRYTHRFDPEPFTLPSASTLFAAGASPEPSLLPRGCQVAVPEDRCLRQP